MVRRSSGLRGTPAHTPPAGVERETAVPAVVVPAVVVRAVVPMLVRAVVPIVVPDIDAAMERSGSQAPGPRGCGRFALTARSVLAGGALWEAGAPDPGKTSGAAVCVGAIDAPNRLRRAIGALYAARIDETRPDDVVGAPATGRARARSGSISRERAAVVRRAKAAASGSAGTGASANREGIVIGVESEAARAPGSRRNGSEPALREAGIADDDATGAAVPAWLLIGVSRRPLTLSRPTLSRPTLSRPALSRPAPSGRVERLIKALIAAGAACACVTRSTA
jgi:hypothetical protein